MLQHDFFRSIDWHKLTAKEARLRTYLRTYLLTSDSYSLCATALATLVILTMTGARAVPATNQGPSGHVQLRQLPQRGIDTW